MSFAFARRSVVFGLIAIVCAGVFGSHVVQASPNVARIITLTNAERIREGLLPFVENALLSRAAQYKAEDMAEHGYYAHIAPDGKTPQYWIDRVGYPYRIIGENLVVNRTDAEAVVSAFMGSPGHRANILRDDFKEIGVGVASGTYKGKDAVFSVQLFGTQREVAVVVTPPVTPVKELPKEPIVATVPQGDAPMTLVPKVTVPVAATTSTATVNPTQTPQTPSAPVIIPTPIPTLPLTPTATSTETIVDRVHTLVEPITSQVNEGLLQEVYTDVPREGVVVMTFTNNRSPFSESRPLNVKNSVPRFTSITTPLRADVSWMHRVVDAADELLLWTSRFFSR